MTSIEKLPLWEHDALTQCYSILRQYTDTVQKKKRGKIQLNSDQTKVTNCGSNQNIVLFTTGQNTCFKRSYHLCSQAEHDSDSQEPSLITTDWV